MSRKIFHRLVPLSKVLDIISEYYELKPLGTEEVDLANALGRVLAKDIYSPIDHPPFDRSSVDGYAVRSVDVAGAEEYNPKTLEIIGRVSAGDEPVVEVEPGKAVEIATGAMIPRGTDSVVMEEYTSREENKLFVYRSAVAGENITTTGSDISLGDLVLVKGTILGSNEIGLLAGLGINRVSVYKKPRIAVFSTGNEVVEPGNKLKPGKVYDVNGYLVTTALREYGARAEYLGKIPDNYNILYLSLIHI